MTSAAEFPALKKGVNNCYGKCYTKYSFQRNATWAIHLTIVFKIFTPGIGKEIENFFKYLIYNIFISTSQKRHLLARCTGNVFNAVPFSKSSSGFNSAPHGQVPTLWLGPPRYSNPDSETSEYSGLWSVKHWPLSTQLDVVRQQSEPFYKNHCIM